VISLDWASQVPYRASCADAHWSAVCAMSSILAQRHRPFFFFSSRRRHTRSARRSASALPAAPREIATTATFKHRKNELARDGYDPGMTSDQLCFSDPKRTPSYRLTACSTAKSVLAACVSRLRAALSLTSECRRLGLQTQ